ncbi:DNA topoisomerase 2 [Cucumispora dikerogammari]|nr:DNA topoisomerase 2 [Cucumispora dikerogammari]
MSETPKKILKQSTDLEKKTIEEMYQKKTPIEHILMRPDTYIGSIEMDTQNIFTLNETETQIVKENVNYPPGLYKIFDEIIVNAADNKVRDKKMSIIRVEINEDENRISVLNDGKGIPIQIHKTEKIYIPELIFGHLLTSSNYNDSEKKITGGRNGYGAKLCNIFSTKFVVETQFKKKNYIQLFEKNMSVINKPQITDTLKEVNYGNSKRIGDFTKITFFPDLKRFTLNKITAEISRLLKKRVYDLAGILSGVTVFLNDKELKMDNFFDYTGMYFESRDDEVPKVTGSTVPITKIYSDRIYEKHARWEIMFMPSDTFQHVSFVNSICTSKGGTHVSYIVDALATKIADRIMKKDKSIQIKPAQIKNHFFIFINSHIENPAFDSQTKEFLSLKSASFGSQIELSKNFLDFVFDKIQEDVISEHKHRLNKQLKRTDGTKTNSVLGIKKLQDAQWAGTVKGKEASLILTEGDSAKGLALAGISVLNHKAYGVYPLRGKFLNVREASVKSINESQTITELKKIMGLKTGAVYNDVSTLRYGSIIIMTDQDHDGSHIKGLIINFLDYFFPSLLKLPGFLKEFITPIVRCKLKGKNPSINTTGVGLRELVPNTTLAKCWEFFSLPDYQTFIASLSNHNLTPHDFHIKYLKGLGSSDSADGKRYFSQLSKHLKTFDVYTAIDKTKIELAFAKNKVNARKEWLSNFAINTDPLLDHSLPNLSVDEFIEKELVLFSMADNIRSIPSAIDGFKPGQRKVLFSAFKRNLTEEIKVAQFGGYISEHAAYHHGEVSLTATIINMAQDFVGSNNINYFKPCGQFGTRLRGGKDAASPRYLHTTLSKITKHVFHTDDNPILKYLEDDGKTVEPEYYVPVLPSILLNGAEGIGTGWATKVPNHNPIDIAQILLKKLELGEDFDFNKIRLSEFETENLEYPLLRPYYRGFKGEIVYDQKETKRYKTIGCYDYKPKENTLKISELPVGVWTETYKELLSAKVQNKEIKNFTERHSDLEVFFEIKLSDTLVQKIKEEEDLLKHFKLVSTIAVTNMVLFDKNGKIKKYETVKQILSEYFDVRLYLYEKRKENLIQVGQRKMIKISNRVRFIKEIIEGSLIIKQKKKQVLINELEDKKYDYDPYLVPGGEVQKYDYLLNMPLVNLTEEKINELKNQFENTKRELEEIMNKTTKQMWIDDLNKVIETYSSIDRGKTKDLKCESAINLTKRDKREIKKEKASLKKRKLNAKGTDDTKIIEVLKSKQKKKFSQRGSKSESELMKKKDVSIKIDFQKESDASKPWNQFFDGDLSSDAFK